MKTMIFDHLKCVLKFYIFSYQNVVLTLASMVSGSVLIPDLLKLLKTCVCAYSHSYLWFCFDDDICHIKIV